MSCSQCGNKLEDGVQTCPKCGTVAGIVSVNAKNAEVAENTEVVEGYRTVRKVKKKRYRVLIIALLIVIGGAASLFYMQYRNNVKELQTYMEQGLIEEAREKADAMPKWQAQKAFDKINHEIQSENNIYIKKNVYDAAFYSNLEEKVLMLYEMEQLNESTIESMPKLQYCYQEAIQNDELPLVEGYLVFLQTLQMDYDESVSDKISHAQGVRSEYEHAKHKYESGSYQEAMEICKTIVPDELDYVYVESVAALLSDIETAYTSVIEENMQRAVENQDYETIYQYIKAAKEGGSDNEKYTEMENKYLEGAIKTVKSEISYEDYDSAYTTCKAIVECMADNESALNLFEETVQEYVKNLLSSADFETAEEILEEGLGIVPENKVLTALQAQLNNDTWRLVYEIFLTDLYKETDSIEFTLYPVGGLEIPYLLVVTGNLYEFYKYDDNHKSVVSVARDSFYSCIPAEGLFFHQRQTSERGYFSITSTDIWEGYSFNGKEFVLEYSLQKINELHYEAFTNKTLSSDDAYWKDNEAISESEYKKQIERIEAADGMTTYSYNEDNIRAVIYNNLIQ